MTRAVLIDKNDLILIKLTHTEFKAVNYNPLIFHQLK